MSYDEKLVDELLSLIHKNSSNVPYEIILAARKVLFTPDKDVASV